MPAELRLDHKSVEVRSLEASMRFYRDVLGLPEIECKARKPNIRWFGLAGGQSLHLIEGEAGRSFGTISTHFCLSCADFPGAVRRFEEAGVPFFDARGERGKEQVRADGVRSVYVQDLDGHWIEVNEDY